MSLRRSRVSRSAFQNISSPDRHIQEAPAEMTNKGSPIGHIEALYVKDPSSPTTLNLSDFNHQLQAFLPYVNTCIDQLPADLAVCFQGIVSQCRLIYNDQHAYEAMLNSVKNVFHDVKKVYPGTVGAFFLGCQLENNLGNAACSDLCVGALPPVSGSQWQHCDELIILYQNGFKFLNESGSNHSAHIFVYDEKWKGFSAEEIAVLCEMGIVEVRVTYHNVDAADTGKKYKTVVNNTDVSNLPVRAGRAIRREASDIGGNSWGWWIFLILLIFLILAALAWKFAAYQVY